MEQENVQNVTEEKVTENTETQTAEEKVEKTFATQEEFNEALKREVARKTRNVPSKEELKAFNEWTVVKSLKNASLVAVVRNINNVVENNSQTQII